MPNSTTVAIVVAAAQSFLDDLQSGLADGTYEEGAERAKQIETALAELRGEGPRPANALSDDDYRELATVEHYEEGVIEIDEDAEVSLSRADQPCDGAYVQAWIWVPNPEAK